MGTITRSFANNITTSGVLLPASLTNNSIANVTAYNAAIATGSMVLLSSQTASNSASLSFTTGIDSTYKEYQFYFIDIHPRTDNVSFTFQVDTGTNTNYNQTITSTLFTAFHNEAGTVTALSYDDGRDQAQGTSFQIIANDNGNGADESLAGSLQLFNPASSTYVKHFISRISQYYYDNFAFDKFCAGYVNTTTALTRVQFKMSSGNFDGTILMYGIV